MHLLRNCRHFNSHRSAHQCLDHHHRRIAAYIGQSYVEATSQTTLKSCSCSLKQFNVAGASFGTTLTGCRRLWFGPSGACSLVSYFRLISDQDSDVLWFTCLACSCGSLGQSDSPAIEDVVITTFERCKGCYCCLQVPSSMDFVPVLPYLQAFHSCFRSC